MPGLVDCHVHPEQVENAGTSYTKTYAEWSIQDFFATMRLFDMNQTYARNAASLIVVRNFMLQTTWSGRMNKVSPNLCGFCLYFCPLGRQRSSKCTSHIWYGTPLSTQHLMLQTTQQVGTCVNDTHTKCSLVLYIRFNRQRDSKYISHLSYSMQITYNIFYIDWTIFQTQRWSLQHGTTTAAYSGSFGVESVMEIVDVVGKFSNLLTEYDKGYNVSPCDTNRTRVRASKLQCKH